MGKDCLLCVYNDVCEGRKNKNDIVDCCIPEAPLRELQCSSRNAEQYIRRTVEYVREEKKKSAYWRRINANRRCP